jgi:hypothetical protein
MNGWTENYIDNLWERGCLDESIKRRNKKGDNMNKQYLQKNDRVRLPNGSNALRVTFSNQYHVTARYERSGGSITRRQCEFVRLDDEHAIESKGKDIMKDKLFQTKVTGDDEVRFGVGLAVDSNGQYVLEMKDGSGVLIFDKKDIEIVMPYTYSVKFSTGPQEYQYRGKAGLVEVGDLLLAMDSQHAKGGISIAQVVKIDSKSDRAKKHFEVVKISTVALDQ